MTAIRLTRALCAIGLSLGLALPGAARATGTLNVTNVVKVAATMSTPGHVLVTGTCQLGAGQVKVFFQNTVTGVATKVYTSPGNCGMTAATTGKTVSIPVTVVPAGTYKVALKQGTAVAIATSGPIALP